MDTALDKLRRKELVRFLRRWGDISSDRVEAALQAVPRHAFVEPESRHVAYENCPLPIGYGQTISQPTMVAIMTEFLEVRPGDRVLEVGTGSGYQAAVLAELGAEVVSLERVLPLALRAGAVLQELGYSRVHVICADGSGGWPPGAPYDGIIVTAAAPLVPAQLKAQLADGGRLVIPVGDYYSQTLMRVTRRGSDFAEESSIGCVFVPLVGTFGFVAGRKAPVSVWGGRSGEDD